MTRKRRFNPRVREGRDLHCPTTTSRLLSVSIHASVKDATRGLALTMPNENSFNPRVREGRDFDGLTGQEFALNVSIHASVKDATSSGTSSSASIEFQSTRP